jgi:hypothetical protein
MNYCTKPNTNPLEHLVGSVSGISEKLRKHVGPGGLLPLHAYRTRGLPNTQAFLESPELRQTLAPATGFELMMKLGLFIGRFNLQLHQHGAFPSLLQEHDCIVILLVLKSCFLKGRQFAKGDVIWFATGDLDAEAKSVYSFVYK